jgi:hypothetical protein
MSWHTLPITLPRNGQAGRRLALSCLTPSSKRSRGTDRPLEAQRYPFLLGDAAGSVMSYSTLPDSMRDGVEGQPWVCVYYCRTYDTAGCGGGGGQ